MRPAWMPSARFAWGRFAEARKLIERMRSLDPNNALVATMEAMVLDAEGDRVAGLAKYQAACSMGQEYACKLAWQLRTKRE